MPDEFMGYMWHNPPRCVVGMTHDARPRLGKLLSDEYGEYTTVFGIHCSCGNRVLEVLGKLSPGETVISEPISLSCPKCELMTLIFEATQHGHDGVLGNTRIAHKGKSTEFKCPKCSAQGLELATAFQYSGDEIENLQHLKKHTKRRELRSEDLFGWFAAAAECRSCKAVFAITDYECA